ncbi:phenylacetic acid degradation bifunctional protein PaaZ [Jannaschia sp. CCS1]|uniref:phenylacetic acid degradation bifunctional protein PaaZ n=1 Tax=Jannaschia sp. (strain CCS1) TaxID=290400 RepID=UPI000053B405|nr:phenylacetic acid degradation bifunctional protein PaaZ [Jannaschia sp. CCS1]ABD53575.1 Phenylacetic acid degradation protein paaN [Jannaschia sp. CCS1]
MQHVGSFAKGIWVPAGDGAREIADAATGQVIALAGSDSLDVQGMIAYARDVGGPALRALDFHDRARMLKALALHLNAHKERLYELSYTTGATRKDHGFDVDGGIGTLFVFASKGRREMPEGHVLIDGGFEPLGRTGAFGGQHIYTPKLGVAFHINAFNFPVWGMLEKIAPAILAGVPSIVKPATATCHVTELCVRIMLEAGVLPDGALQLITGGVGDALGHLGPQDAVTFTGSAATAGIVRGALGSGVPFTAEQDSLNASILGPDAEPGTPEFDLFLKEVCREMTTKAGQKCTAIRRVLAPQPLLQPLIEGLSARLSRVVVGDPREEGTGMGPVVSASQRDDVLEKAAAIGAEAECVFEGNHAMDQGAFVAPRLFHCADPDAAQAVHATEAFGPVSTVMGYRDLDHAVALANRGEGSLVASLITHDTDVARQVVQGIGAWHGRVYINDRDSMGEATGHGAPMPHLTHGGPGRAGGGEELGGIRAVKHYMQRVAVQGSPTMLSAVTGRWVPGAARTPTDGHPFQVRFGDLAPGRTLRTDPRTITLDDIAQFAEFTGDTFYAHMDEAAAKRNPFFPGRVAHGYLILSFAAGLFVEPNEGPVLANTGLDNLRFLKPVSPGDSIAVDLTVMDRKSRNDDYGEVRWHAEVSNQDGDAVAEYELLTMVAK